MNYNLSEGTNYVLSSFSSEYQNETGMILSLIKAHNLLSKLHEFL